MALHLSRTLALKAAGLMAIVLIFFNLIGLRLEIKFDRSPLHSINLTSHTSSLQWPKRTHSNHNHHQLSHTVVSSTTTIFNNKSKPILISNESPNLFNHSTIMKINGSTFSEQNSLILNVTTSNSTTTTNKSIVNENFTSENGDIKLNEIVNNKNINHSQKLVIEEKSDKVNKIVIDSHHHVTSVTDEKKQSKIKKTKYQDFDASLVPDDGIFSSIMKVLGLKNQCPVTPPNLVGPVEVDTSPEYLETVEKMLSTKVQSGGRYKPKECRARDRVAIVVPYRDRKQHLPILLKNLHPFLMKQQIDYGIFLVEQSPDGSFNRAKLMNIGFVEALKIYDWDCFIFHDVDLLPMDDRNLYNCPTQPRHMSVAIDTFKWQLPYSSIFGGVSSMTTSQFKAVNGFSNSYFGWGGEDDDLSKRLKHMGYHIARYPVNIARYTMLSHKKEKPNPKRYEKLVTGVNRFTSDGLNSLKYKLLDLQVKPLYTWIYVDITTPDNGS